MTFPKLGPGYFTERQGVLAFAEVVNNFGYVFRETANADVGIDGQVEHVDGDGNCTGHVIAVQVKSGTSYSSAGDANTIIYYPNEKHINYWRSFPVPVILAIIQPDPKVIFWTDVRRYLRSPFTANEKSVRIPRKQVLVEESKFQLFESSGSIGERLLPLEAVLHEMAVNRSNDPGFQMSFFELFALGLVDIGTKLFFSMSLCMEIAEYRAANNEVGVGVGFVEQRFVDSYIDFLVAQNLINYDYSDYLIDRDERQLQPTFICQLTHKGRAIVEAMQKHQRSYVVHESLLGLTFPFQFRLPARLNELEQMQHRIVSTPLQE